MERIRLLKQAGYAGQPVKSDDRDDFLILLTRRVWLTMYCYLLKQHTKINSQKSNTLLIIFCITPHFSESLLPNEARRTPPLAPPT